MRARIALDSPPRVSINELAANIGRVFGDSLPVGTPEKTAESIRVSVGQAILSIAASSNPISFNDPANVVRASEPWSVTQSHLAHQSHLVLSLDGPVNPIDVANQLAAICRATLNTVGHGKGVFWESSGQWIPADIFQSVVASSEDLWRFWVTIQVQATDVNQSRGFTCGMHSLGHREIEVRHATEPASELVARIAGLIDYLLTNGPVIKHRDTFGQTRNEKIRAHHIDHSEFGIQGPILCLDYTGAKVIPAPTAPVVTASTSASGFDPQAKSINPAARGPANQIFGEAQPFNGKYGQAEIPNRSEQPQFPVGPKRKAVWPVIIGGLAALFVLILGGTALFFLILGGDENEDLADGDGVGNNASAVAEQDDEWPPQQDQGADAELDPNVGKGLAYNWNVGDEHVYDGELTILHGGLEITVDVRVDFDVRRGGNLGGGGTVHITAKNRADRMITFTHNDILEHFVELDSKGRSMTYGGHCSIPYLGLPVSELIFIDLEQGMKEWSFKSSPNVKTIETMNEVEMRPFTSSQVRYTNYQPKPRGQIDMGGFGGGRDRFGIPQQRFGGRPPMDIGGAGIPFGSRSERLTDSSDATEFVSFVLAKDTDNSASIDVEYLLQSEEKPQADHEIDFNGTYVFDKSKGRIQSIDLTGRMRHTKADPTSTASFTLTMNRLTRAQITADRKAREERLAKSREKQRQREMERIAEREKRDRERRIEEAANEAERNRPWDADKIAEYLRSGDRSRVRDALRQMEISDPSIKNENLSKALVESILDRRSTVFIRNELKGWFEEKECRAILEQMTKTDDFSLGMRARRIIKDVEFDGKIELILKSASNRRTSALVQSLLMDYESDSEPEFFETLDNEEDIEVLEAALTWISMRGTRKSLPRIRRLAKRVDDPRIQSRCQMLEFALKNRR